MAYYAKVLDGVVVNVIVSDSAFFDTFVDSSPGTWIEGTEARKNYPGVGYTYDTERNAFIPKKPFPSWILNETTCVYDAPTARPSGENWFWNETAQEWQQT